MCLLPHLCCAACSDPLNWINPSSPLQHMGEDALLPVRHSVDTGEPLSEQHSLWCKHNACRGPWLPSRVPQCASSVARSLLAPPSPSRH